MQGNNTTLGAIVSMKEATTTDIVEYLCQKGIVIPNDPDYIPTASELIAIDPILAIRLKIAADSAQSDKEPDILEVGNSAKTIENIAVVTDDKHNNQSVGYYMDRIEIKE